MLDDGHHKNPLVSLEFYVYSHITSSYSIMKLIGGLKYLFVFSVANAFSSTTFSQTTTTTTTTTTTSLNMARTRGLERRREGATPEGKKIKKKKRYSFWKILSYCKYSQQYESSFLCPFCYSLCFSFFFFSFSPTHNLQ